MIVEDWLLIRFYNSDGSGVDMTRYCAARFALIGKDIQAWVNLFAEDSASFDRPNLSFLPKI
ncbi:hypothetical protein [Microcoleus vaginatus]|uniref:hypothetical protein n=1 Tax=Microcoleus vaginatus TaxID=119532 RepID=UPI0032A6EF93